jgi:uncharacterized protein YndB with AHSA1/START domain
MLGVMNVRPPAKEVLMHAKASIHIDAPVEMVDSLMVAAGTWPQWVVGMGDPDKIEGDGGAGTRIEFPMEMGGKRFHLSYEVQEYEHNSDGSVHWHARFDGDSRGWETWDYTPKDGGTEIFSEMEADPFPGVVSKIFAFVFVERLLNRNARQSLENLKRLAETESTRM